MKNLDFDLTSRNVYDPPVKLILDQHVNYSHKRLADQITAKSATQQQWYEQVSQTSEELKNNLSITSRRAMDLVSEKEVSN